MPLRVVGQSQSALRGFRGVCRSPDFLFKDISMRGRVFGTNKYPRRGGQVLKHFCRYLFLKHRWATFGHVIPPY